jgi:hypothetical protein
MGCVRVPKAAALISIGASGLGAARHPPRQATAQQDQDECRTGPQHGRHDVLHGRAVRPAVYEPVGVVIVDPDEDHGDSPRDNEDAPDENRDASTAPASKQDGQCQRCEENPSDVRMLCVTAVPGSGSVSAGVLPSR